MAKVTGFTAQRMLEIEASCVVDGEVVGGHLILEQHDGTQIDAGSTLGPPGPQGPPGVSGIPGEVKLWPNTVLPEIDFGHWVWADGEKYLIADHPIAASHIGSQWRTFGGPNFPVAPDPGAGYFRVPDLRGLVAAGLDQMPGGTQGRANRITRADAITMVKTMGEEKHVLLKVELAKHSHGGSVSVSGGVNVVSAGAHSHVAQSGLGLVTTNQTRKFQTQAAGADFSAITAAEPTNVAGAHGHPGSTFSGSGPIAEEGSDTGHENVQPTVFMPYIILLDG